jgi:hypothetical protein
MSDLVVDTTRLRAAAARLRLVARVVYDTGARGERLAVLVPAAGHPRAVEALDHFLFSWTYGMALVAHEVLVSATALDNVAHVLDAKDAAPATGTDAPPIGEGTAPAPVPELPSPGPVGSARPTPRWGGLNLTGADIQLSSARRPSDLVSGEPEDLHSLAAELRRFAVAAAEAGALLKGQLSPQDWAGRAAAAFAGRARHLPVSLDAAADAFHGAGRVLRRQAEVLADAQHAAAQALALWQEAEHRSQIWRGVIPADGAVSNTSEDPRLADMQRAAAMVSLARREVEESSVALASALTAAAEDAPRDPGTGARAARSVSSFTIGTGEGARGALESAALSAVLAVKLDPVLVITDPHAFAATLRSAATTAKRLGADWPNTAFDADTWKSDPARAAGHLAPAVVGGVIGSGMKSTAERAATTAHAPRRFVSTDVLVGDLANTVEEALPGRIRDVNVNVPMANGRLHEVDIDLGDVVVQVKSDNARGLTRQIARTAETTGLRVVGYARLCPTGHGPTLPGTALRSRGHPTN